MAGSLPARRADDKAEHDDDADAAGRRASRFRRGRAVARSGPGSGGTSPAQVPRRATTTPEAPATMSWMRCSAVEIVASQAGASVGAGRLVHRQAAVTRRASRKCRIGAERAAERSEPANEAGIDGASALPRAMTAGTRRRRARHASPSASSRELGDEAPTSRNRSSLLLRRRPSRPRQPSSQPERRCRGRNDDQPPSFQHRGPSAPGEPTARRGRRAAERCPGAAGRRRRRRRSRRRWSAAPASRCAG